MNEKRWRFIFTIVNLIAINGIIIAFLNLKYPFVGHDYNLGIPSVLDSVLHFRLNGLTIQWFTPSFGAGIPAFPNPNNVQFSLVVFLAFFLPPWQAVMLSIIIYISAGFLACEYFLRQTLKFHWTAGMLGAVFFSANGYMVERVIVGHLGFSTFPLLAIFLIALLDESLPVKFSAAIMGLLIGMLFHFAGYFILIIFVLSILITLPLIYILDPKYINLKRLFIILGLGGTAGLLISLSKLAAVYSFMRFFPRIVVDHYGTSLLLGSFGLILQLLGTMNLTPLFLVAGLSPDSLPNYILAATGADYGFWEVDMSITPVVIIILLAGVNIFFHHPRKYIIRLMAGRNRFAFLLFLLFFWLTFEFALAKGVFYPLLRNLPILNSLHVNPRFASAFIFPLTFTAALLYNRWAIGLSASRLFQFFILVDILAILPLNSFFIFREDLHYRFYDIRRGQMLFEQIRAGESFDIIAIGNTMDNTDALLTRTSNLNLYEPAFGYKLEKFQHQVHDGSIWDISDNYYNMTNPTSYVWPELYGNVPFARFRVDDKQTLEIFASHLQPKWEIPLVQKVLNWVSGLSFLLALVYLMLYGFRRLNTIP